MTIPLITALKAAETLAIFHRERASNEASAYDCEMAVRVGQTVERIKLAIEAAGVTVDNQAEAVRRRDLEIAMRIIDKHPIMHGRGMPAEEVGQARLDMAGDIADAFEAVREGAAAT